MKTYNENTTLVDFEAWSCAIDTKERIVNEGKAEDFDALIGKYKN